MFVGESAREPIAVDSGGVLAHLRWLTYVYYYHIMSLPSIMLISSGATAHSGLLA